ncbi:MAG: DUF86 domain-containing protein [Gemmataceae bacterium]
MRNDRDYLEDIRVAASRILEFTSEGRSAFEADVRTQDAVIRNIQVIGEAVKHHSPDLRAANPQVPWRNVAGTRNLVVHHYFLIDFNLIWDIIEVHLPALLAEVSAIQDKLSATPQYTSQDHPENTDETPT